MPVSHRQFPEVLAGHQGLIPKTRRPCTGIVGAATVGRLQGLKFEGLESSFLGVFRV